MSQRLWTSVAAVSLLLSVLASAVWIRSQETYDRIDYQASRRLYSVVTVRGDVFIAVVDRAARPPKLPIGWSRTSAPPPNPSWDRMWHRPHYAKRWVVFGAVRGAYYSTVLVPLWLVALTLLMPPAVWVRHRHRRRTRARMNLCPHCGYDLRATPDRCPECGIGVETENGGTVSST